MKASKIALLAAATAAMVVAGSASATVFIATQLNGGAKVFRQSGATAAVWSGNVGNFQVATASGVQGTGSQLLDSSVLLKKTKNKPAATLDIWITATDLSSLTGIYTSSFTNNVLPPAGWSLTETTYYSTTNSKYGGTQLAQESFTGLGAIADVSGKLALTGPYSVTHQYHLSTNTSGGNALGTVALSAVPSVPEPATWAMMLGGFGLAGSALRRRSGRVQAAA